MHQNEIGRLAKKASDLQKRVIKEKKKRETLTTEQSYSNPAKLMNYMKAKKASGNSSFRSHTEYVSHVDAYARNTNTTLSDREETKDETESKQIRYAKLLAHKRLNDKNPKASKPPKNPGDSRQYNPKQATKYKPPRQLHH